MKTYSNLYINGHWVAPAGTDTIDVVHSHTEQVIATIPAAGVADVNLAVAAARAAFDGWAQMDAGVRAGYLQKIADGLTARKDELAQTIAAEVGMPLKLAARVQIGLPIWHWGNYARLAREFVREQQVGNSLVVREPVGVVACITPWNFPLSQVTLKVAAALAAGCTVILKPSEVAPINTFILAEVIAESGLPAGVFNLVTGYGPVVGEALATHPQVDMVSFTGSTRAGKRVSELAAASVKRVALELGGKSASVLLPDADFGLAVKTTVAACFLNSGQTCSAHTRMLVPESRLQEAKDLAKTAAQTYVVGDPLAADSKLGPLVSAVQRDRVIGYIKQGIAQGMELVVGGVEAPRAQGFYVQPTIFATHDSKAVLAQEEVFGPVLTIISYIDEKDAIRIANDSLYGLGGAVWAGSDAEAIRVARQIRTGQVDINGGPFNPQAPFGGYKQSGTGRENGTYGLEEYLQYKSLQLKVATTA